METAEQLPMFDEVEKEAEITPQEVKTTEVRSHKRKTKRTHDEIFAELPVEKVVHTAENATCDRCGAETVVIEKKKVRNEPVYVPARMFLRHHIAEVVKCTVCGMDESRDADLPDTEKCHMRQAPVPEPMMPGSFFTPELLAHIVFEKYCQAVPLYRQERDFEAMGVRLSRTTMANWLIMASELWLKPVW